MQCSKCGAVLEADTVFCPECGAMAVDMTLHRPVTAQIPVEETPEEVPEILPSEWKTWSKTYRGFLVALVATVGALLMAAIAVVMISLHPGSYTTAIENYIEIVYEGNFDKLELLAPEMYWDRMRQSSPYGLEIRKRDWEIQFMQELTMKEFYCGEDMVVSYEVTEEKPVEDAWLDRVKGFLRPSVDPGSVKEVYAIQVTLKFSGSKGSREEVLDSMYAILIDNCWHLAKGDNSYTGGVSFYLPYSRYETDFD